MQLFKEEELSFKFQDNIRSISVESLFESCYILDQNEVPHRYKLKELSQIIPKFNEKVLKKIIF
jgi:hypothetical protein